MSLISFAHRLLTHSPFSGLLRIHGQDIARIQRLIDPILLTLVFTYLEPNRLWSTPFASFPFWGLVFIFIVLVLPGSGIYTSYRRRSLYRLIRQITSSWLLILALLLLATYFNKSTAYLSRVATSSWALFGWIWLVSIHGFGRKFLRWYRIQGGNSRSIVYWGTPEAVASFSSQLTENSWLGFYIQAWFSPVFPRSDFDVPNVPTCAGGIF